MGADGDSYRRGHEHVQRGVERENRALTAGGEWALQAQCVRHLVLFPQHARNVVKAGAIPLLNKLTESKVRETRLHAQGALLSLGGSAGAVDIMKKCDVPQYILFMSSMKMVEEEKKVAVLERKAVADALKEEEAQNRVPQVGSYKSSGVGAA